MSHGGYRNRMDNGDLIVGYPKTHLAFGSRQELLVLRDGRTFRIVNEWDGPDHETVRTEHGPLVISLPTSRHEEIPITREAFDAAWAAAEEPSR